MGYFIRVCSSSVWLTSSSARWMKLLVLGTFTNLTSLKCFLNSRTFRHKRLSSEFLTAYSPVNCLTTSSLSRWQVTSSELSAAADSKAAINARYSAWLLVHKPMKRRCVFRIRPSSERIRNAAAAGPGLPLAPPSEKTINRTSMLVPSPFLFIRFRLCGGPF